MPRPRARSHRHHAGRLRSSRSRTRKREIYHSAQNFRFDRSLAKELGVPLAVSVSEWEERVRANIELGWPADWVERKYIPPDWKKVFPLIGGPPVGMR